MTTKIVWMGNSCHDDYKIVWKDNSCHDDYKIVWKDNSCHDDYKIVWKNNSYMCKCRGMFFPCNRVNALVTYTNVSVTTDQPVIPRSNTEKSIISTSLGMSTF